MNFWKAGDTCNVSWCGSLDFTSVELLGYLYSCLSSNLGSFSHYFCKYSAPFFLLCSWDSHTHMLVHLMVFHRSLSLCFFQSFFFLFFSLDNFHLLILSFAYSDLSLNASSEFFISVIVLFSPRISFLFLSRFSLYWYFHFVHTLFFSTFSTSSFISLSIFKIVVLMSLSSISVIRSFSGTCFCYFVLLNEPYFPVSLYSLWFFVEHWTFEFINVVNLEVRFSPSPGFVGFCYCFSYCWRLISEDQPEV